MSSHEPNVCVEPLGFQPVEFLNVPPMSETRMLHAGVEPGAQDDGANTGRRKRAKA